ncbi:MAG: hypothetical protein P1U53_15465 [Sulfitobacter sp.]|nr:hypothetical protein [Sulfitobacter sp.]
MLASIVVDCLACFYINTILRAGRCCGRKKFRVYSSTHGDVVVLLRNGADARRVAECWRGDGVWSLDFGATGVAFDCKVSFGGEAVRCSVDIQPDGSGGVRAPRGCGAFDLGDLDMFAPSEVFTDAVLSKISEPRC